MRSVGFQEAEIRKMVYENPVKVFELDPFLSHSKS
jgi:predicted metal-dependent phosphotriesterase family hydrolase